jgi:hypothetical protein
MHFIFSFFLHLVLPIITDKIKTYLRFVLQSRKQYKSNSLLEKYIFISSKQLYHTVELYIYYKTKSASTRQNPLNPQYFVQLVWIHQPINVSIQLTVHELAVCNHNVSLDFHDIFVAWFQESSEMIPCT